MSIPRWSEESLRELLVSLRQVGSKMGYLVFFYPRSPRQEMHGPGRIKTDSPLLVIAKKFLAGAGSLLCGFPYGEPGVSRLRESRQQRSKLFFYSVPEPETLRKASLRKS
jgi:hypothetical protein